MKILVTGANGYLGQGIVKKLCDIGQEVIATDIKVNYVDDRAKKIKCNLFEIENPYQFFEEPDVVLHLAWRDGFIHYSENHISDLFYHYIFVKKMMESDINMISIMGSMHEIGFFEGSINENTPCNPESYYGVAKNALCQMTKILAAQNNKKYQWLRGYYIVGNSEHGSSIFSKITIAEKEKKEKFPFTKGLNQFDFVDYKDFCEQVVYTVIQNKEDGVINICSGRPEKLSDRVERFIKESGYKIKLEYGAFPDRPYDSKAVWGDNTKITRIMQSHEG